MSRSSSNAIQGSDVHPVPCHKRTLTSGAAAKFCGVAPRTISKWFDSGRLKGYKLPGSNDRRIYTDVLAAFMRDHGMRVPVELLDPVTVVYALSDWPGGANGVVVPSGLELGLLLATEYVGRAVLGDDEGLTAAIAAAKVIRERFPEAKIAFALSADTDVGRIKSAGFEGCSILPRPVTSGFIVGLMAG